MDEIKDQREQEIGLLFFALWFAFWLHIFNSLVYHIQPELKPIEQTVIHLFFLVIWTKFTYKVLNYNRRPSSNPQ